MNVGETEKKTREKKSSVILQSITEIKVCSMFSVITFMLTDSAHISKPKTVLPTACKFLFYNLCFGCFINFGNIVIVSLMNFINVVII